MKDNFYCLLYVWVWAECGSTSFHKIIWWDESLLFVYFMLSQFLRVNIILFRSEVPSYGGLMCTHMTLILLLVSFIIEMVEPAFDCKWPVLACGKLEIITDFTIWLCSSHAYWLLSPNNFSSSYSDTRVAHIHSGATSTRL
jgi:hypothetical protein